MGFEAALTCRKHTMKLRSSLVSSPRSIITLVLGSCALAAAPLACSDDSIGEGEVENGGSSGEGGGGSGGGTTAGSGGSGADGGSAGSGGSGGNEGPSALQIELYQSLHTEETCQSAGPTREQCLVACSDNYTACYDTVPEPAPGTCDTQYTTCQEACPAPTDSEPSCVYANIYFLATCNGANVNELAADDVTVVIGTRDVGVEGAVLLTQQNGLQVDLLLDRSYSITEAQASETVRTAANDFLDALPEDAKVRISAFASEQQVPEVLGGQSTSYYYDVASERETMRSMIVSSYSPYQSESSAAFTKLFDAAVGMASSATAEDTSLAALPSVAVIFTDGTDTASSNYDTAAEARSAITSTKPGMKVYAIGLGNDVDEAALETLSENRYYSAADQATLGEVFEDVANQLGAIYRYRVLVPSAQYAAPGRLTVNHCGETQVVEFYMDTAGSTDPDGGEGENSCYWAFDNECDEPNLCDPGTDSADCDGL